MRENRGQKNFEYSYFSHSANGNYVWGIQFKMQ